MNEFRTKFHRLQNDLKRLKDEHHICHLAAQSQAERIRELEAENAALKRQRDEAIHYILTDEGHSMIDWRMCFFAGSCECEPSQCKPDYEMCKRAVIKAIEESGE